MTPFGRLAKWLTLATVVLMLAGADAQSDDAESSSIDLVKPRMNGFLNDRNDEETMRLLRFFGDDFDSDDDDSDDDDNTDGDNNDDDTNDDDSNDNKNEDSSDNDSIPSGDDFEENDRSGEYYDSESDDEFIDSEVEKPEVDSLSERAFLGKFEFAAKDSEDSIKGAKKQDEDAEANRTKKEGNTGEEEEEADVYPMFYPCSARVFPLQLAALAGFLIMFPCGILRCLWPTTYAPYLMGKHQVVCLKHEPAKTNVGYSFHASCMKSKACQPHMIIMPLAMLQGPTSIIPRLFNDNKHISAVSTAAATAANGQQFHAVVASGQQQVPVNAPTSQGFRQTPMSMLQQTYTAAYPAMQQQYAVASPAAATAGYQPMRQVQGVPHQRAMPSSRASYV